MQLEKLDPLRVKALALYEFLLRSPGAHLYFTGDGATTADLYSGSDTFIVSVPAEIARALEKMELLVDLGGKVWIPAPQKIL